MATVTVNKEKDEPAKSRTDFTKNFPLPDEKGSPCFVTVNPDIFLTHYFLAFADFVDMAVLLKSCQLSFLFWKKKNHDILNDQF